MHLAQALALAQLTEDRLLEAESYAEWAAVHAENDNLREALVSLNRAHGIFRALRASRHVLRTERMMAELQPRYLRTVTAYGEEIVGASDPGIGVHARRVASYATVLGRAAGVAADDVVALRTGALLHDIGKAIVPRSVLTKPGRLTGDEWEVVKSHTVVGEDLVADLGFAWDIAPIVRHHHEHWDGSGYPDELAGEAIPLMARIVCVADVFDALTNARAYRRALAPAEALAAMGGMADSILDPGLFRVFEGLAVDGEIERAGRMAVELATA